MAEHNLELLFNMDDLGEKNRDDRECAEADGTGHGKRRKLEDGYGK